MNIPISRFDSLVLPRVFFVALMLLAPLYTHPLLVSPALRHLPTVPRNAESERLSSFVPIRPNRSGVAFQARSPGGSLFFTSSQVVIVLPPVAQTATLPSDLAERRSSGTQQEGVLHQQADSASGDPAEL